MLNNPTFLLIAAVIVILLLILLAIVIYLLLRIAKSDKNNIKTEIPSEIKTSPEKQERKLEITEVFPRLKQEEILGLEEKMILEILLENQGNILQKDLPRLTNYSKSTITRIISRLEEQDFIYRSPAGRGYRIFLRSEEKDNTPD
ncbi:MAG: helix-turn-helix transcriptional regulator [Candidatus Hodarchaeales archaeon]